MPTSRRTFLAAAASGMAGGIAGGLAGWSCSRSETTEEGGVTRYVRYEHAGNVSFGELAGDTV